ncbi:MAG: IgA Peptidase M64 [Pyrinomonadaceae bacterium]
MIKRQSFKAIFRLVIVAPKLLVLLFALAGVSLGASATMRLDYYHTGNATQELFSLDRLVIEPLPWPGNPYQPVDHTNLGKYLFEVIDRSTNRIVYSRGFASIYGEWETTDEAKKANRTFHESLRFPAPQAPVQVVLKKRDASNAFREIWSLTVDPEDIFINRAQPPSPGRVIELEKNGDPATKVDFLILGDGYQSSELKKFESDARRLLDVLFATSPFKERRRDFNVWAICPTALESGISRPSNRIYRQSPLGTTYDAFGSERYVLTFDNRAFREIASFAPYEFVEILANNRTYGGGGIFGLYSTVASDSNQAPYIFVHEFGHHFAGLADEYYTSPVAYAPATERVEPWEPNATALLDPKKLKWKDLVSPGTPIPTPWDKETFEKYSREYQRKRSQIRSEGRPEEEMEALFREVLEFEKGFFAKEKYFGKVGAFEGAIYEAKGYYRPEVNCIMFTRTTSFCAVCRRSIERVVDLYTKRA